MYPDLPTLIIIVIINKNNNALWPWMGVGVGVVFLPKQDEEHVWISKEEVETWKRKE